MLLLAFDTAGPNCAVALARSAPDLPTILARAEERMGRGHAERLMPMIEAVLGEARASYEDVDRIAVTTGPGSFTGVRVGIAAARGLALALARPAVGIGSLTALAFPVSKSRTRGASVALLDARRGELFVEVQDLASGQTLLHAEAIRIDDLMDRLSQVPRPLVLCGAGAQIAAAALDEAGAELTLTAAEAPDIGDVADIALRTEAEAPPVPLYARGADAKPQLGQAVARR